MRKTAAKNSFNKAGTVLNAAVLLTLAIAGVVLLGWTLDLRALKSVLPSLTTMKANTAVCFALTAAALWASRTPETRARNRAAVWILAALALAIACVTLAEYAFGWQAGIDELLFRDREHQGTQSPPGRFAPGTGICFLLLAGALLLLDGWPLVSQALTLGAALVSLIGLIGYLYNLPSLYGAGRYTSLAFHTVLGFLALTAGMLSARPARGLASLMADAEIGPLIAGAVFLPLALGSLTIAGERLGWYGSEFTLALFSVLLIVLTVALVWKTGRDRQAMEAERLQARSDLVQLNLELETRVRQRTVELEAANRELEAFSYTASHDLRAPLRSMAGFSQFLLEDHAEQLDAEGKSYLVRIRANAQQMGQLINDMLALSRVSRAEPRREDVDLSALAVSILADLRETHPDREVEFDVESGIRAEADRGLARALLVNLLGNAWKYTAKTPQARIRFGRLPGGLPGAPPAYFVADNGAGFGMEYAERMFQPFQRLHGSSEFEGTGIGLATVQRIVQRHGGWIRAEGKVNEGATFFFTLNSPPETEAKHDKTV